ncbi:MAG: GNAT family protein [Chloroflexota bacterium]
MTGLPLLTTERLVLRPFAAGDVDDALVYRDDPEFARFLPHIPQPFTRNDAERFVATNMTEPWDQFATFAIVLNGHVIGTVNLDTNASTQTAMLGYAIGRAYWGRGIAPEAAQAVLRWAFESRDLERVWASTDVRHMRSRRVLERLGMQHEATLRAHAMARDGRTDEVVYGLLRSEWDGSN